MAARPHDLDLPIWGPYSKAYAGLSHLPDLEGGLRFDLSVFPGFFRGRLDIPNVQWESGYVPWEAASDLSYYAFRHKLDGERVVVEAAYSAYPGPSSAGARLVRMRCINRSDAHQTLVLHLVCGARYPAPAGLGHKLPTVLHPATLDVSEGGAWVDARDFVSRKIVSPRPNDNLCPDGWTWREVREDGCVDGGYLYIENAGEALRYRFELARALPGGRLLVRARLKNAETAVLRVSGALQGALKLSGQPGVWQLLEMNAGGLAAGPAEVTLTHDSPGARIDLDLVALVPAEGTLRIRDRIWNPVPARSEGPRPGSLLLSYPDLPATYGLWWNAAGHRVREWHCDLLDMEMRVRMHDHVSSVFKGAGAGHWTDVLLGPIALPPRSSADIWAVVAAGARPEVRQLLAEISPDQLPGLHETARARRAILAGNPSGALDEDGQRAMAACTLTNVTYPVYTRRRYVRHFSPGKAWDCLYTWDLGFLGLGMLEIDPRTAQMVLEQYLMPEGDEQCAYLQHGTPLPVQIYLAHELWNRTQDRAALARAFAGLRQFHRFLVGRYGNSPTRRLKSGLIATWDIFYNSGGWDDYPPQMHVHAQALRRVVAPMANTAHAIRTARLLKGLAGILGVDGGEFDADIAELSPALQLAWDAESGYFGYLMHDAGGRPVGILRHETGANFNLGLDGVMPLLAGVCTPEQEQRLIENLADPRQLWTSSGLTAVSRAAPYFSTAGYWNGTVWMAHQWFIWKTLLDLGHADLAWQIAETGLRVWRTETGISGNCYEHFPILTGRGAGWHHFTSLSAPVLSWYGAYHRPGRLTGGHGLLIKELEWSAHGGSARLSLEGMAGRRSTVLACLQPGRYQALWNDMRVELRERHPGCFECALPCGEGLLQIGPAR